MSQVVSLETDVLATVPADLRALVESAFEHKGKQVQLPAESVKQSCEVLSLATTAEILKIRRAERSVSSGTLAFSFA